MNYNEFVQAVLKHFTEQLGDEYTVSVNEVMKNNHVQMNGILMKKKGQKVTPNIYLNSFYEQYIEEDDLNLVLQNIWNTYQEALDNFNSDDFDFNLEWENQKDSVIYRLVNYEENKEKLSCIPYIRFLDLAITFHCIIKLQDESVSMLPITNTIMDHWNIDIKYLFQCATDNTPLYFPLVFSTLEDVIKMLVGEDVMGNICPKSEDEVMMYVITNEQGINGATVMLYQEEFQQLAAKLGGKLYILPSSIHELILIPFEEDVDEVKLAQLVQEVNQNQVPLEEVLSNHIYLYDSETRTFEVR